MTRHEYIEFCKTIVGVTMDCPFESNPDSIAIRHSDTRKWLALIMKHNNKDIVNLKCEPMQSDFLRSIYEGVTEAYHMNKVHWNSVYLESDVPNDEIERMTIDSFNITLKNKKGVVV